MRQITFILFSTLLAGCVAGISGYQQFYKPYVDPKSIPNVQLLAPGEQPTIYSSNDLDRDTNTLIAKGFWPVGASAFNGALESEYSAAAQAVRIGAQVVLMKSAYTNTQTNTIPLVLPSSSTTYGSGTAYGSGGTASYYGSSTTYGTTLVPITSQQRRYDQSAMYFVRLNKKYKFGIRAIDLTPEQRMVIERNTGVFVATVIENTPAFVANILPGDILIRFNGVDVQNTKHVGELMDAASVNSRCKLTVLRNGKEKNISVHAGGV